jgi:hypothetical protein
MSTFVLLSSRALSAAQELTGDDTAAANSYRARNGLRPDWTGRVRGAKICGT